MVHSFTMTGINATIKPLASSRKPFSWAIIQARPANSASVRVVALDQTSGGTSTPTTGGVVLAPGSGGLPGANLLIPWMGAPLPYDFSNIFIITSTGEGVDVLYGS